jgi:hypothetical protein
MNMNPRHKPFPSKRRTNGGDYVTEGMSGMQQLSARALTRVA